MKLLALKFYNLSNPLNAATACQAIAYAVNHGAQVINLSWHVGSQCTTGPFSSTPGLRKMCSSLRQRATREPTTTSCRLARFFRAAAQNLVSVMATKPIPVMATDQYDDSPASRTWPNTVRIAAPGVSALFTRYGSPRALRWRLYAGTSVALRRSSRPPLSCRAFPRRVDMEPKMSANGS